MKFQEAAEICARDKSTKVHKRDAEDGFVWFYMQCNQTGNFEFRDKETNELMTVQALQIQDVKQEWEIYDTDRLDLVSNKTEEMIKEITKIIKKYTRD